MPEVHEAHYKQPWESMQKVSVSDTVYSLLINWPVLAKKTLFAPLATLEALQAMSEIHDREWLITKAANSHIDLLGRDQLATRNAGTGHGVSEPFRSELINVISYDMNLHECLPQLAKFNQARSTGELSNDIISSQKSLLKGCRLWLIVVNSMIEWDINRVICLLANTNRMAFAYRLPVTIDETGLKEHWNSLLNHPYSLLTDARLISFCEILLLRRELYSPSHLTSKSLFTGWAYLLARWIRSI